MITDLNCPPTKTFDPEAKECRPKSKHLKPCANGFERNPETKRCRKVTADIEELQNKKEEIEEIEQKEDITLADLEWPPEESTNLVKEVEFKDKSDIDGESGIDGEAEIKMPTIKSKILNPCREGYFRNPETGRCKKITIVNKEKPCPKGQEKNPETKRCRKVKILAKNTGADHPILSTKDNTQQVFTATLLVALVLFSSLIYVIFQFRKEIGKVFNRLFKSRLINQHNAHTNKDSSNQVPD